MHLEARLDSLHISARSRPWLSRFAWANRVVLALAFLPSGMTKLMGERFTSLGIDTAVGFFFEAMFRTGPYWRFLGLMQVAAAIMLLIPRTHALASLMYFAIVTNVFLITVGVGFRGTPYVVGMMLLASLFLVCWHYDAWRSLVFPRSDTTGQRV